MHRGNSSQNPIWTHSGNVFVKANKALEMFPNPSTCPAMQNPARPGNRLQLRSLGRSPYLSKSGFKWCVYEPPIRLGTTLSCEGSSSSLHWAPPTLPNWRYQQSHKKQMAQSHPTFSWHWLCHITVLVRPRDQFCSANIRCLPAFCNYQGHLK